MIAKNARGGYAINFDTLSLFSIRVVNAVAKKERSIVIKTGEK